MQARRWAARGVDVRSRFTRRMNFMLLMSVLHGTLIWKWLRYPARYRLFWRRYTNTSDSHKKNV